MVWPKAGGFHGGWGQLADNFTWCSTADIVQEGSIVCQIGLLYDIGPLSRIKIMVEK